MNSDSLPIWDFYHVASRPYPANSRKTARRLAFGSAFLVQFLHRLPMLSPIVDVTFDF